MVRSNLLANNNRAYSIATKKYPTVKELEELGEIKPGWSLLFAIKDYLLHHLDFAMDYKGFVPFGGPVIAFLQSLENPPVFTNFRNPTYKDHVTLRELTNAMAKQLNLPSIVINNWMYIEGRKIDDKMAEPEE